MYAPGYNVENIKTLQVDMPDVFQLVSTTEEGIDTGVIMFTDVESPVDGTANAEGNQDIIFNDVYVNGGLLVDNTMVLNRTDDIPVSINLEDVVGWYDED